MSGQRSIPHDDVAAFVRTYPKATGYGPALALKYGVSLKTAQRWVYQCRLKGLLPPGDSPRPCPHCAGTGVQQWGNRWSEQ